MGDVEWISGLEAATRLGVSKSTVYRSLADPDQRAAQWGKENEGWRRKPLSTRGIFEVNAAVVEQKIKARDDKPIE